MIKLLVIGSAGFVGSNFIRYVAFNHKNIEIISVDKISNPKDIHNVYMNKSSEFYLCDVCDQNIVNRIFEFNKPDYVIYLGLSTNGNFVQNNIMGFYNVLQACKTYKSSKVIFVKHLFNKNSLFTTTENTCASFLSNFELPFSIINTVDLFGSRQEVGLITNFYQDIRGNGKIILNQKGSIIRDILHVEDLSSAIMSVIENNKSSQSYDVSANIDFTDLEIANIMIEALGEGKIEFGNEDCSLQENINIDSSLIRENGWKPKKFKDRLKQTTFWFKQNEWFFR